MKEHKDFNQKFLAGAFFIAGIFVILMVIFTIGKDKGFAQRKFQISVLFRNIGGLTEGAPTRLSGVNVGNVASIDFLDQNVMGRRVKVTLNIFNKYKKQLKGNARFAIKTEGVLGEKLVEIYFVDGGHDLDLSRPVLGEDPLDVQDLAEVFAGAAESFTKTAQELSQIKVKELSEVMRESSEALLTTAEGLNAIMQDLKEITVKSKRLFNRIEQKVIDGELFTVF